MPFQLAKFWILDAKFQIFFCKQPRGQACMLPYFNYRDKLKVQDGTILGSDRIVTPTSLRHDLKIKVHAIHHSINSCLRRALDSILWPGNFNGNRTFFESCDTCATAPDRAALAHSQRARSSMAKSRNGFIPYQCYTAFTPKYRSYER